MTAPDGSGATPSRRRPPPGRLSPQAMADARGGAREGLAWLGRTPESRASIFYRLVPAAADRLRSLAGELLGSPQVISASELAAGRRRGGEVSAPRPQA